MVLIQPQTQTEPNAGDLNEQERVLLGQDMSLYPYVEIDPLNRW